MLAAALASTGPVSAAETPQWAACHVFPAQRQAGCPPFEWVDEATAITRLTYFYSMRSYVALEMVLREAIASTARLPEGTAPSRAAFWMFARTMRGGRESHETALAWWDKLVPNSLFTAIARARLLYAEAWQMRGDGRERELPRETREVFRITLNEARQALEKAPGEIRDTPLWHHMLLVISLDAAAPDAHDVFQKAVARWPDYYDFHDEMAVRLLPQWGGSREILDRYIDEWSRRRAPADGTSFYARIYSGIHRSATPRETLMDWARMRASFIDLVKRHPAPKWKNRFAAHACYMRDKDAFRTAVGNLAPADVQPQEWLMGHSYDACMRWATI